MHLIKYIVFILLFASTSYAATTIDAQVVRNQAGSGITQISAGFPVPPGLVTEAMVTGGLIKVTVGGSEVAANVTGLRGRHPDGTLRSVLIQFLSPSSMAQNDVLTAQVIVDGGARASSDPTYIRPTWEMLDYNNVILATSPAYIVSTNITFNNLLIKGAGTADEEKFFTAMAENRFDALVINGQQDASYEEVRAMLILWARTGDKKFHKKAISYGRDWYVYNIPQPGYQICPADDYINPDDIPGSTNQACGQAAETQINRMLSYAALYLTTGYRDFWSFVAYQKQMSSAPNTTQGLADLNVIKYSTWDTPRFSFLNGYADLIAAYLIDATAPIPNKSGTRVIDFREQFTLILNAIENNIWDAWWIPYDSGTGNCPTNGSSIAQGATTATILGVYTTDRNVRRLLEGAAIPASGWIQVKNSTKSGNFVVGTMTSGISINVTGAGETDWRNGIVGARSYSPRDGLLQLPNFQFVIPSHFMINYYMNIEQDSRIPGLVKTILDLILTQISPIQSGDGCYGQTHVTWGSPSYGYPYDLDVTYIRQAPTNPWEMGEWLRMTAFVLKTVPDASSMVINGATYETWYNRMLNTGNIMPSCLGWKWKHFGQYYGLGADATWIIRQTSLPVPTYRVPTFYAGIPGEAPDLARGAGGAAARYRIKTVTNE